MLKKPFGVKPSINKNPQTESEHQIRLFHWANYSQWAIDHPETSLLFAVPNGGLRNKRVAATLKREGVKSGVPDMILAAPTTGYFNDEYRQ